MHIPSPAFTYPSLHSTCSPIHAYMSTYTHTYSSYTKSPRILTHTHTHTHTHTLTRTLTHSLPYAHAQTNTHTHTHTHRERQSIHQRRRLTPHRSIKSTEFTPTHCNGHFLTSVKPQ